MAATVWDDATRTIAAHRTRHQIPADVEGLGPPPSIDAPEHGAWSQAAEHLARTRIWLATHDDQLALPITHTRSLPEIHRRLVELEAIFATAPPDHRRLIDQLTTAQVTLDDTASALEQALAGQHQRQEWILQHWPHIVEHTEITRTLLTSTEGPALGPLLDQLTALHPPTDSAVTAVARLADAARTNQTWLRTLLGHVVPPDAEHIDEPTLELLARTAAYRRRWHITGPTPLGVAATTEHQARESADLTQAIHTAISENTDPTERIEVAGHEPQGLGI